MGDHDDNHNHGHKKRGEILHLEKIITKKKRTNKYHKDQVKYWKDKDKDEDDKNRDKQKDDKREDKQEDDKREDNKQKDGKDKGPDVVRQARQVLGQQLAASCFLPFQPIPRQ